MSRTWKFWEKIELIRVFISIIGRRFVQLFTMASAGRFCPARHALPRYTIEAAVVTCDSCGVRLESSATAFGCRRCDFDLCARCGGADASGTLEECPICAEDKSDVAPLAHSAAAAGDVSSHKACGECRATLLARNQRCPFCRTEVVWSSAFGFLESLKGSIGAAGNPDELANLIGMWQEFELTRSKSDVLLFARDMIEDRRLVTQMDRALSAGNAAWLRDSFGLWARFYALVSSGEVDLHNPRENGARINAAVQLVMTSAERDGGGNAFHGGALYCQISIALLAAQLNGMETSALVPLCQRIGRAITSMWSDEGEAIRRTCPFSYVEAVSELVWGSADNDVVRATFFT
jgi:hypothetical protein